MSDINENTQEAVEDAARKIAALVIESLQRSGGTPPAEYLTPAQTALLSGFSPKALEALRSRRQGPRYFKVGNSVRYRAADVRAWIEMEGAGK